jgi:hypothetical protein
MFNTASTFEENDKFYITIIKNYINAFISGQLLTMRISLTFFFNTDKILIF